jgi:predicted permease
LIQQLLTESLLLALGGAVVGMAFAQWGKDALVALRPMGSSTLVLDLPLDWRVLGFTTVIAIATGIIFGLLPALRATRVDLNAEFQGGGHKRGGGRSAFARGLMIVQVALSFVLLVGAALFLGTLRNLQRLDVGFDRSRLLVFRVDATAGGRSRAQAAELYRQLNERLVALPGVAASAYSRHALLNREGGESGGGFPGVKSRPGARTVGANVNFVSPEFFQTFGIPFVSGRGIEARDAAPGAPPVIVVNEAFVRRHFPDRASIGEQTTFGEIIGIVRDAAPEDLRAEVPSAAFMPFRVVALFGGEANFALRTTGEPRSLVNSVMHAAREIDPRLPLFDLRTQEEQISRALQQEKMFASLAGFFGLLALALVCVGLYGLMSYAVARRTGEIGIRMALGALPRWVLCMIMQESLALVTLGVVLGGLGAVAAGRLIAGVLYGLSPVEPALYGGVGILLMAVALFAAFWPARRAAGIDPMVALRVE